jgi:hypothetical protein
MIGLETSNQMVCGPLLPTSSSQIDLADSVTPPPETDNMSKSPKEDSKEIGETKQPKPRTWQPSSSNISIQATWWGYRLYLPPPVLDILSDAQLATARKAALITTSLKWIVDSVPLAMVPVQLRPAMLMLKRLTPYVGYVGTFIAWSWERIKQKDGGVSGL